MQSLEPISAFFTKYLLLESGKPRLTDLITIIPFVAFFLLMRHIIWFTVLQVAPAIIKRNRPTISQEELVTKKHRIADQAVKLLFHLTAAIFASEYFGNFSWWIPNLMDYNSFMNWELQVLDKVYYMYQAGYHIHSLIHFFFLEKVTKADDFVMGTHHIVTVILIFASYVGGSPFYQFGAAVYYVHDASDIFIANVKIMNYLYFPKPILVLSLLASLAGWIYFRIYTFGVHIILVALVGSIVEYTRHGLSTFTIMGMIFFFLLSSLWCMHIYWLRAIIASIHRVSTTVNNEEFDASDAKMMTKNAIKSGSKATKSD